ALAGPGTDRGGTGKGGPEADAAGPGGAPGHRGRSRTAICPGLSGQGLWARRSGRHRAAVAGRGVGAGAPDGGAVLRGGTVSAQRGAAAPGKEPTPNGGGRGGEFASGPRRGPSPARQVVGVSVGAEPGPA